MAAPVQQAMLGPDTSDDDGGLEFLEPDADANLICPDPLSAVLSTVFCPCWITSLKMFEQNEHAAVMVWGKYVGSIKEPGIHIVNPCGVELRRISTMRKTLDVRDVNVTDHAGNPVFMSGNVAYRLFSAKKSQVDTRQPEVYIRDQAPMVLRKVGSRMSYDELRGENTSAMLQREMQAAVEEAGVEVLKFQLTDLRYSPDIAQAMLGRQQAEVQVDAKKKIVMGAAETASATVARLKQLNHNFSPENEQRLIHDLLLKNLDPEYKQSAILMGQAR